MLQAGCSMAMGALTRSFGSHQPAPAVRNWGRGCPLQGGEEGAGAGKVGLSAGLRTACTTGTEASSKECAECGAGSPPKGRFLVGIVPIAPSDHGVLGWVSGEFLAGAEEVRLGDKLGLCFSSEGSQCWPCLVSNLNVCLSVLS